MALNMNVLAHVSKAQHDVGTASIEPTAPIIAGTHGTWHLKYCIGASGIATGGVIRVDTDTDTDWGWPQIEDPTAPDYVTLTAPRGAELTLRVVNHQQLQIVVTGRPLTSGETFTIIYGDRRGGSPGSRAQTFSEERHHFWIDVDVRGTGEFVPIADVPVVTVIGGEPVRLNVIAPSDVELHQPLRILFKAEDEWGNPATVYRGTITLTGEYLRSPIETIEFRESDGGVRAIEGVTFTKAGIQRVVAKDATRGLRGCSNPISVTEVMPALRIYWGDPHGGQVADPRKISGFFNYARNVSGISFAGFQRNDYIMPDSAYGLQQSVEREYHEPGRFIAIPGYEWTGEAEVGGHRNVYFRRFDQPVHRSSHAATLEQTNLETDLPHVLDLYRWYRHKDVVITAHVGGVHSDLTYHDPDLEPAVEVSSSHGSFEWILRETIERGYKCGFVGGSDSFTGRPGDDRPGHQFRRYAKAGLTAVFAPELSIEAVLSAIRARRCYATSGARIRIEISADGHAMGSEYVSAVPPTFQAAVTGTAPLERVEIYRGLKSIYRHDVGIRHSRSQVRVLWEGASRKSSFSGVIWNGQLRVTGSGIAMTDRIRFDSPRSTASMDENGVVRWCSWTCGYPSGLIVTLDRPESAAIEVLLSCSVISGSRFGGHGEKQPLRMAFSPVDRIKIATTISELMERSRTIPLGVLDRRLTVEMAPQVTGEHVDFSFRDKDVAPGINVYWMKVTQVDGEQAWTSPVFVDYAPDPRSL